MSERYRCLAADGVVVRDGRVLLMRRDVEPHRGDWVLPGGMVERDETSREACAREVREEVGLQVETLAFLGLYDDPGRDERGNVSAAYLCRPLDGEARPRKEAREVDWFDLREPPETGFDHGSILADAVETLDEG